MKPILYVHGGSGNHGCEAIARTLNMLFSDLGIESVTLTANISQDRISGLANDIQLIPLANDIDRTNIQFLLAYLKFRLTKKSIYLDMQPRKSQLTKLSGFDTAIAIGGDTYSYSYSDSNTYMHDLFRKKGMKTVLWGCSIDPNLMDDSRVLADLHNFDLITARESITYDNLLARGFRNVKLFPDMAFSLPSQANEQSLLIERGNTIGLNVSPLIMNYQSNKNIVLDNFRRVIEYILKNTKNKIALIPHVIWTDSDDRKTLNLLYDEYNKSGRLALINDCNCMQLKDIISRLKILICARTHASIAAYSSGVPTLVLGYSVKARGIAKDIWGEDGKLVVPVQNLRTADDLLCQYIQMEKQYDSLRLHLKTTMPRYISRISMARDTILSL